MQPDKTSRWLIIRHGQTQWNIERRYQGQQDSPLTPCGQQQVVEVGRFMQAFVSAFGKEALVYASPLGRAQQSLRILEPYLPCAIQEVVTVPELKEMHFGSWGGLGKIAVQQQYPAAWQQREADKWHYRIPGGGESYACVWKRIDRWIRSLPATELPRIVIAHESFNRTLRGYLCQLSPVKTLAMRQSNDHVMVIRGQTDHLIDVKRGFLDQHKTLWA